MRDKAKIICETKKVYFIGNKRFLTLNAAMRHQAKILLLIKYTSGEENKPRFEQRGSHRVIAEEFVTEGDFGQMCFDSERWHREIKEKYIELKKQYLAGVI